MEEIPDEFDFDPITGKNTGEAALKPQNSKK